MSDEYFKSNFNTVLSPKDEMLYLAWAAKNGRQNDDIDYDMRGAWKANVGQSGNGHYPDTFKKPNHPTFSDQSMYHGAPNPDGGVFIGGTWMKGDGNYGFRPSAQMADKPGYIDFMKNRYMPQVEKGNVLLPAPDARESELAEYSKAWNEGDK